MTDGFEGFKEEIKFYRRRDRCNPEFDTNSAVTYSTSNWTELFVNRFLFDAQASVDSDDLLFFVRKKHIRGSTCESPKFHTELEVYRRDSKKLPIGNPDIAWDETVYLNLIIHSLRYELTVAVCSRTSLKDFQVLKKHTQKVFALPSRRRMDSKSDTEDISFPDICFSVDNFDDIYENIILRDGEFLCVELVARDAEAIQGVLFFATVPYHILKQAYTGKNGPKLRFSGKYSRNNGIKMDFARIRSASKKGYVEVAITKVKQRYTDLESPISEPEFSASDTDDECEEAINALWQRRVSDPNLNVSLNYITTPAVQRKKPNRASKSQICEIETCELAVDEIDGSTLWSTKGCLQTFHFWKESRRSESWIMNSLVTCVSLPWYSIIYNLLESRANPVLSF
ncbi:uncharacterized protein KIAA0930 homolog [Artemia franciscana]|uniref:uncharacterized protein KIAA0930 homolog n=1 Tax=Artemia franciscana TaxID=6661 RepID=UPI0032DA66BF